MAKKLFLWVCCFPVLSLWAQQMTPEKLWSLGRLNVKGITADQKFVIYQVNYPDIAQNKWNKKLFKLSLTEAKPAEEITQVGDLLKNDKISADGKYVLFDKEVLVMPTKGTDLYPDLPKSDAYVFNTLNYRHWDTWEDGQFSHPFVKQVNEPDQVATDLLAGRPYDCPTKPFGGDNDYIWHPSTNKIIYVTKPLYGTDYTVSTNTDLFEYDVETKQTKNITAYNKGYDVNPSFNSKGILAWMQMKRDGYEADKQDIVVYNGTTYKNLTKHLDEIYVEAYKWSNDGSAIYFTSPTQGTLQLYKVLVDFAAEKPVVTQITKGDFDINGIVGETSDGRLIVTRADMNQAAELYTVQTKTGVCEQLTHINDAAYQGMEKCKTERVWVKTTDNKKMLVWVIYPPNFNPNKKYPALLYCQGGPQSPLTQYYSFRWNFQLMANQGYIVVAPNRRGMPGHGTQWNEQISKDWGGQVLKDYLSAIDSISNRPYVDKNHMGCVGASFGGYSVFALEALHGNRFKSFIAHDGVFDFRSMYGTTDEMFFETWEKGGAYWEKNNAVAQRSFSQSPSNFVEKWKTPIMIVQGGKDYRVPIEQGLQAFQAAQLRGIKSKLLYLPDENHWVLSPQNALVWQREFFKWLQETMF